MKTFSKQNLLVTTLCVCVAIGSMVPTLPAQNKKSAPVEATPPPVNQEFKFEKVDLELWEQSNLVDHRFEREGVVFEDEATSNYLDRIGHSLIPKGLKLENVVWKFRAVRDPQPNAFALPNGSIYVTTGLLSLMDNESQLAAVLAHELTHVMRRHSYLQNRSNRKKFLTVNIMAAIGAYAPGGAAGAVIMVAAAVAPFIVLATMFGYSRELEREADLKGIDMMISAEYPPEEMVKALQLLSNDIEGEQVKLFYNDHPELQERVKYLSSYLGARAGKVTPEMELHREKNAYFRQAEAIMRHDIQLSINSARFRSAVYLAQRLVDFHPESSEDVFWLAEAYRTLGPRSQQLTERELTNSAKKESAKKREKRTAEEEERELLSTPAGQENAKAHQLKAEELYLRSLSLDSPTPAAHRGLGMLYEQAGRPQDAVAEYQKYLALVPAALDRERIQRRIETLTKGEK